MPIAPYEFDVTVAATDIDLMDHVNNVAFVRMVQDAALKHWFSVVSPETQELVTWVCRRHEIDYLKPAFLHDILRVKTWVGEPSGATWERFTEIVRTADQAKVLQARTVWAMLDAKSFRPRRVDATVVGWFEGNGRTASASDS